MHYVPYRMRVLQGRVLTIEDHAQAMQIALKYKKDVLITTLSVLLMQTVVSHDRAQIIEMHVRKVRIALITILHVADELIVVIQRILMRIHALMTATHVQVKPAVRSCEGCRDIRIVEFEIDLDIRL